MIEKILRIAAVKHYIKQQKKTTNMKKIKSCDDTVNISDQGLILSKIFETELSNDDRILELKESIRNGTYHIDIEMIADKIIG